MLFEGNLNILRGIKVKLYADIFQRLFRGYLCTKRLLRGCFEDTQKTFKGHLHMEDTLRMIVKDPSLKQKYHLEETF